MTAFIRRCQDFHLFLRCAATGHALPSGLSERLFLCSPGGEIMSIRPMVATILFSMGTLSLACSHSPTAPSVIGCSTDALRGSYGSQRNGQAAPGTAFTSVGLAIFDGVGHLTEQLTVSTN